MTEPLLVRAARGEPVARTPVWLMRQAGRYLPEYREVRARVAFEDAITQPEVATELTLQPVQRFGVDGAVIFSDIMAPLPSMGVPVAFTPGPTLTPLRLADADSGLHLPEDGFPTATAITLVRAALPEDDRPAVIGFCGAPTTLAAYLLEGSGSRDFLALRTALAHQPGAVHRLLDLLSDAMGRYVAAQVGAGADVVQIFDSWAGVLSAAQYEEFAYEPTRRLVDALRSGQGVRGIGERRVDGAAIAASDPPTEQGVRGIDEKRVDGAAAAASDPPTAHVPVVYFAPGAHHLAASIARLGADVVGVDWRRPLAEQWAVLPAGTAIQGNVDPAALLAGPEAATAATRAVLLEAAGRPGHILNLGHGVDQHTPVASVEAMVETARQGIAAREENAVPCAT